MGAGISASPQRAVGLSGDGVREKIGNRKSEIENYCQSWTWVRGVMERSPPAAGRRFNSPPAAEAQMRRYAAEDEHRFDFSLEGKFNDSAIQRFNDSKIRGFKDS